MNALEQQLDNINGLVAMRMKERALLRDTLQLLRDTARQYVAEGIPLFDSVIAQTDKVLEATRD